MKRNIAYETPAIARYFSTHRVRWADFYESERVIIERLGLGPDDEVLDIGCGCGGLGLALHERFGVERYTGVEINREAARVASGLNRSARILCGDIVDLNRTDLRGATFDAVFSLSCVDWNANYTETLHAAWQHVKPGGRFVATFRLTNLPGCDDFDRSHQYINYDGKKVGELAAYVVLNVDELLRDLRTFQPADIAAFGYWGAPSATAETPYDRLCFAAFSVRKADTPVATPKLDLQLPVDLFASP